MNWKALAEKIAKMTPEQQGTDVTVLLSDSNEFQAAHGLGFNEQKNNMDNFDVLDPDHPYLFVDG